MEVAEAVARLGGVCTWRELRGAVPWRRIGEAVESGEVVRLRRGLYGLGSADDAVAVARRLTGILSHRSAALHWGWKVKTAPRLPEITLARHRRLPVDGRDAATLHWRTLPREQVRAHVTTPVRTVVDCCLDLPFDEALSVFDSALRSGLHRRDVLALAVNLGPRHRKKVLAVARHADGRAANPFESVLRAIAIGVQGLAVQPQVRLRYEDLYARVDLADEALRVVIEADSHEFHAERRAFDRDCRRYDELAVRDWLVLRFTWEQVMFEPDWVTSVLVRAVALQRARRSTAGRRRRAAASVA
jgi:very-short-patch-repair endonuclease